MDQYQTRQSFNYPGRSFSHSPIEQNYPRNYSSMGSENGYNEKHDMSSKDVYPTNKLERKIQSEARKASSIKRGDSNQLGITPVYWNDQMSRPLSMVSKSDIGFSGDGEEEEEIAPKMTKRKKCISALVIIFTLIGGAIIAVIAGFSIVING